MKFRIVTTYGELLNPLTSKDREYEREQGLERVCRFVGEIVLREEISCLEVRQKCKLIQQIKIFKAVGDIRAYALPFFEKGTNYPGKLPFLCFVTCPLSKFCWCSNPQPGLRFPPRVFYHHHFFL